MRMLKSCCAVLLAMALAPGLMHAQEAARVTGRVTDETGSPVRAASVVIRDMNIGTITREDGTYMLLVPAARIQTGQTVELSAQSIGFASSTVEVTLRPGATVTQNFALGRDVLELEGIVATGQGTTTTRERLASTVNTVRSADIERSREANVVSALAGKAPNVQVTSTSGEPGAGAYIQIRGAASVVGGTQPLFVLDGTPIDNSSVRIEGEHAGTQVTNRAADINPNDIERVEILKGAAATAIYGTRGANGVVLITTKSGQAGSTRATYSTSYSIDDPNRTVPLQTRFSQGIDLAAVGETGEAASVVTWGEPVASGTPVFDHANEIYQTGHRFESNITLSGGSERTTWYLSAGQMNHEGVIVGNSRYDRTTVRLKGTHDFRDNLTVGGNFAYTDGSGDFVQQGSNISGVQLGALRTPPEYNNQPYLDPETGLHISYRCPSGTACASSLTRGRGYDNPFWIANEIRNDAGVGRAFGNVHFNYRPLSWLNVNYVLGADYASDERLTVIPKSSSDFPVGRIIRGNIVTAIYDHNLLATATGNLSDQISGSLTLGQNLNHRDQRENLARGTNLIFGTEETDFAVDVVGDEFKSTIRTDGYFATSEVNFHDQLTLNGTLRLDGSSTFGGGSKRFLYPGVGASWVFTNTPGLDIPAVDFGKLRASFGISGRQPPVFSNVSAFQTGTIDDGWVTGVESIYLGQEGVFSEAVLGNADIRPEKKAEFEVGADLAFLDQRLALGVTYYDRKTTDAILFQPTAPSTGYAFQWANAAEFENNGWEVTLDLTAVRTPGFDWTLGAQYGRNESCVTELAGAEDVYLGGFTGSTVSLVRPDPVTGECHPFGVFFTDDFVRFGRGITIEGIGNIDDAFSGWSEGDLFIGADGFPAYDPQYRVTGDPNPDWTGSLRSTMTFANNLRVSGLLDIKAGGDMWNGTRGALYFFGTHKDTEAYHGIGKDTIFPGFGPGAGETVKLNWATWTLAGLGSGFTGPSSQFIEDAGFVKLRDISVSYTLDQQWLQRFGFSAMDLTVSGRNLKTWTDYTGIDPESNLWGQSVARGIDYFNNPQTRSLVFSVNLNR
jgi:TonB-linked SusC/RagA family outer membrane protein